MDNWAPTTYRFNFFLVKGHRREQPVGIMPADGFFVGTCGVCVTPATFGAPSKSVKK